MCFCSATHNSQKHLSVRVVLRVLLQARVSLFRGCITNDQNALGRVCADRAQAVRIGLDELSDRCVILLQVFFLADQRAEDIVQEDTHNTVAMLKMIRNLIEQRCTAPPRLLMQVNDAFCDEHAQWLLRSLVRAGQLLLSMQPHGASGAGGWCWRSQAIDKPLFTRRLVPAINAFTQDWSDCSRFAVRILIDPSTPDATS